MLKKLQVLKKHLLDAGKVPDAGKYLFKAGKTASLLESIAQRYLDCPENTFPWKLRQLLEDGTTGLNPAVQI